VKVLIIDDEILDITLLKALTEEVGCEAVCFTSSLEALEWCEKNDPDLVIVDCIMPPPNGLEFIHLFRGMPAHAEVPIIMVTASTEREIRYQALELGANEFIIKPVDKIEFIVRMNNMLALSQSRTQIRERNDFLSDILNSIQDSITILDKDLNITAVNPQVERQVAGKGNLVGQKCYEIFHGRKEPCLQCPAVKTISTGEKSFDIVLVGGPGETESWFELYAFPLRNSSTGELLGAIEYRRDITRTKKAEERLEHLAHYDALTGLPNRTLFFDRFNHALSRVRRAAGSLALLFLDLDGFKLINDNLGHDSGDILLKGVSERLLTCVRESDTVARMGGDEFTLILESITGSADAGRVAEKIIEVLAKPFNLGDNEKFIGASIGISVYPDDGDDTETLLKKSDSAMYAAKKSKDLKYVFYHDEDDDGMKLS
jgi:diguanylate cyclase (GGDEF)-like protein/PAS domain S-box-containing protein